MDYFAVTGPEIGASFPRFYTGFGVGMGYSYRDNQDTVAVDLNNTQYKLSFGYDIISSHRVRMTPMVSLRWLKYRLRNYSADKKVPLEEYLRDKEIDLRFSQIIATAGLNLEYIMYAGQAERSDYWSLGIFGGYAAKLNKSPGQVRREPDHHNRRHKTSTIYRWNKHLLLYQIKIIKRNFIIHHGI
jgi:hypothetical protein